jgi:hypothetical protein
MPVLKGSETNPSVVEDRFKQLEINKEGTREQRRVLDEQLGKWQAFHDTEMGSICAELAEPKIRNLDAMLAASADVLVRQYGLPLDAIEELRAEWRGARKVWYDIMYAHERLKREAEMLKGLEEEPPKEGLQWKKVTQKIRKRLTKESESG